MPIGGSGSRRNRLIKHENESKRRRSDTNQPRDSADAVFWEGPGRATRSARVQKAGAPLHAPFEKCHPTFRRHGFSGCPTLVAPSATGWDSTIQFVLIKDPGC